MTIMFHTMFQEKKCSKNVGHGSYLCTLFTEIACRSPYAVFLGRLSAREIHSITLDETHDENVASFGSQNWKSIKPKLFENNSDLYLDTLYHNNTRP